ncbi:threonine/serine exporter family protein [uncultured Desulfovibrio sp.]|uniref:threonine/serine exporter family protein n=1 Tax=uncultured Desulfovibrio sp. TaxID=167968 RepID=UPI00260A3CD9|nr:threonine/serine exporter family protein [uncultured Desulfovibrio sp.]
MSDFLLLAGKVAADGLFAVVACIGFALISNASRPVCLMAGLLAGLGHATRYVLLHLGMGITSASLCAATLVSFCSMFCARRWHTPAEFYAFPALLPMIPGMYAYRTILATMHFLSAAEPSAREALLVEIAYNALTTCCVMGALVIGAIVPLFALHEESPLARWRHHRTAGPEGGDAEHGGGARQD